MMCLLYYPRGVPARALHLSEREYVYDGARYPRGQNEMVHHWPWVLVVAPHPHGTIRRWQRYRAERPQKGGR